MSLRTLARSAVFIAAASSLRADVTYTLNLGSSANEQQVAASVTAAAALCNTYGSFNKHWNVFYNSGIPTAEANYDGYMGYGSQRTTRVVLHEAGHTFGMGTGPNYGNLIAGGVWKGRYGNQVQFDTYNTYGDGLHGDGHAIWPGGFNYESEDGFIERIWMIRIMAGIRADMGIMSYTKEARNNAVVAGETAEFRVESPIANGWQWYRNGVALANGGDISGANTPTLRIANVEAADAGSYHCAGSGANETLNSRARQLWVHPAAQLGQWNFNGSPASTVNGYHGTVFGSPNYATGKIAQAIDLDGTDDYVDLPDAVGRTRDMTVASWVNWDGGNDWQRVFDFGTNTYQYFCLTPKAGGAGLRLVLKDAVNAKNTEYQVNAPVIATGQWVHLAAVIRGSYMSLYVNGKPVGSTFGIVSSPGDFPATNNYIGKSQYNDPYFNGRIDDFRLYGKALDGPEIWALWGQSTNNAPAFSTPLITLPDVSALNAFPTQSIASFASDADSDTLTFTKLNGPAWLNVAANGTISGQPGPGDGGLNTLYLRVTDPTGATSDTMLQVRVFAPLSAPVTSSSTAPVADSDDAYYLASNIVESNTIGGTTNSTDNDAQTYVAEDRTSKGQTFTTGSNPQGYSLQSFTFAHVGWPNFTSTGTYYDIQPGDQWEFQVGSMSGTTKTPLLKYIATYDGAAMTGNGTSGTGRYLTFNVSGLGVQLSPGTTYYFEIAPLSGDPFFELNSAKNGNYAGGTAFSGSNNGTIGTGVTPLSGDYVFLANLEARSSTPSSTVAWWNFEEGVANTYVPYSRTAANQYEGSIVDRSGNANHLSVWTTNWHWYRAEVPTATTPQTGAANTLSMRNAGSFPSVTAIGTTLTTWSPTAWTIEATIRPEDATNSYQTFIGRDSRGAFAGDPALAAFYFAVTPTGGLRVLFTDAAANNWGVTTGANTLQDNKWYAVAATSDGDTLSLYMKAISDGATSYTLLGTADISASTNPALSTGSGDGGDWDAGVFTFARGLYNGGHTDRFFGNIDDVRFSNGALAPSAFLQSEPPAVPGYAAWIAGYPAVGAESGFNDDPDDDGIVNGLENFLGTNPSAASRGLENIAKSANSFTFRHPQNAAPAGDIVAAYRWSFDLQNWNASGVASNGTTVTFAASPNTPEAGITTVTATITGNPSARIFVDLQVTGP